MAGPTLADWLAHIVDPTRPVDRFLPVCGWRSLAQTLIDLIHVLTGPDRGSGWRRRFERDCVLAALHATGRLVPPLEPVAPPPSTLGITDGARLTVHGDVRVDEEGRWGVDLESDRPLPPPRRHGEVTLAVRTRDGRNWRVRLHAEGGFGLWEVRVETVDGVYTWDVRALGTFGQPARGYRLENGPPVTEAATREPFVVGLAALAAVNFRRTTHRHVVAGGRLIPPHGERPYVGGADRILWPEDYADVDARLADRLATGDVDPVRRLVLTGLRRVLRSEAALVQVHDPEGCQELWADGARSRFRAPLPSRLAPGAPVRVLIGLALRALDRLVHEGSADAIDLCDGTGRVRARRFPRPAGREDLLVYEPDLRDGADPTRPRRLHVAFRRMDDEDPDIRSDMDGHDAGLEVWLAPGLFVIGERVGDGVVHLHLQLADRPVSEVVTCLAAIAGAHGGRIRLLPARELWDTPLETTLRAVFGDATVVPGEPRGAVTWDIVPFGTIAQSRPLGLAFSPVPGLANPSPDPAPESPDGAESAICGTSLRNADRSVCSRQPGCAR